jgi:hypothetical protein
MDVGHERAMLYAKIAAISSYNTREDELLRELKAVRAQRAAHDEGVRQIITGCEEDGLNSDDWRQLLDGIHPQVSAALARHSMRGI